MTWVFVLFMNGWPVDVEKFATQQACEDKVRLYTTAFRNAESRALVWCEHRPQA